MNFQPNNFQPTYTETTVTDTNVSDNRVRFNKSYILTFTGIIRFFLIVVIYYIISNLDKL